MVCLLDNNMCTQFLNGSFDLSSSLYFFTPSLYLIIQGINSFQLAMAYSKLIETLEQGVKYVQS